MNEQVQQIEARLIRSEKRTRVLFALVTILSAATVFLVGALGARPAVGQASGTVLKAPVTVVDEKGKPIAFIGRGPRGEARVAATDYAGRHVAVIEATGGINTGSLRIETGTGAGVVRYPPRCGGSVVRRQRLEGNREPLLKDLGGVLPMHRRVFYFLAFVYIVATFSAG